jgi:hypothetical protein
MLALSNGVHILQVIQHDDVLASLSWDRVPRCIVLRNGMVTEIPADDLVPGDVVFVSKVSPSQILAALLASSITWHTRGMECLRMLRHLLEEAIYSLIKAVSLASQLP